MWTAHVVESFDSAISLRAFWINSSSFSENKNRRINQIKLIWTTYPYSMNPQKPRKTWVTDRHQIATQRKGNLVLYCDLSSALFSYTQTFLFHLNGHTTLLHPKTQKLEPHTIKVLLKWFHLNCHTTRFHWQTQNLEKHIK